MRKAEAWELHKGRGRGSVTLTSALSSGFGRHKTLPLLSGELEIKSSDIRLRILSINPLDSDLLRSLEGLGCYQQKEYAQPQTQKTEVSHPSLARWESLASG